jgi:hypothetical protein
MQRLKQLWHAVEVPLLVIFSLGVLVLAVIGLAVGSVGVVLIAVAGLAGAIWDYFQIRRR